MTRGAPPPLAETLDAEPHPPAAATPSAEAILEEFESEARTRPLGGRTGRAVAALAVALSLYALYWVVAVVEAQLYRASFLLVALVLTFLVYVGSPGTELEFAL